MKLYFYIRPDGYEDFLAGDYSFCLRATDTPPKEFLVYADGYVPCGSVDAEINADHNDIRKSTIRAIDKQIKDTRAKAEAAVMQMEARKQSLMAIEHIAWGSQDGAA